MEHNLKILMATMGMEIGGAETHILELSLELKRRGFRVYVASNGGVYEKDLEAAGIRHYRLPLHNKRLLNMLRSYRGLRRIIREERIDIVHGHARIPSFLCGLLHKKMKFPFITTAHWVFKLNPLLRLMTDWGQLTVAVSNDIKTYLIDNYGVPKSDISVTINGIDTNKFSDNIDASAVEQEFDLSPDRTRIVYVSRMDSSRSLVAHHLIEVAPKLDTQVENLEIVIVGGGDDFAAVKAEADAVNAQAGRPLIKLTGARTDINQFIKTGKIFVGVSRSALEAMAAGKPSIIAGNEGYIGIFDESKLEDGIRTNFCCRGCLEPSAELLYRDILTLLRDTDEAALARLGAYGRETILEHYSVSRMTQDYIDAYERLLMEKKLLNDVVISGYYGFKNNGDDALLSAIIEDLKEQIPEVKICVLSYRPYETQAIYGVEAVNRFNLPYIARAMKGAKLLVSGGGSLIQDGTSTQSLIYYLHIMRMAKRRGLRSMLYANGIGPLVHRANIRRARHALDALDLITLRDPASWEELEKIGLDRSRAILTADPAFNIEPASDEEIRAIFKKHGIDQSKRLAGISVRQWKMHGPGFEIHLANTVDYMSRELGLTPVFLNMQYPMDIKMSRAIMQQMKTKAYTINDTLSDTQMLGVIRSMDIVVGERLHTLIYAAAVGIPFVGIVYDPKIKAFMEYVGQKNYVDLDDVCFAALRKEIDFCIAHRDEICSQLAEKTERMRALAKETAVLAASLIRDNGAQKEAAHGQNHGD